MSEERFVPVPATHPTPLGRAPGEPTRGAHRVVGRPAGLTREAEERFLTALRSTGLILSAAEMSGIPRRTVTRWIARGEGALPDSPPTPEYVRFARLVREQVAAVRVYAMASVLASKNPEALLKWQDAVGDPEWVERRREMRAEGRDDGPHAAQPVNVTVETHVDARQQNLTAVFEIPDDRLPDFLRSVISQSRAQRAVLVAEAQTPPEQVPDGHRSPRLDRLRASAT